MIFQEMLAVLELSQSRAIGKADILLAGQSMETPLWERRDGCTWSKGLFPILTSV